MAITIDWSDRIISIPRADMTLVQSVPVEIRDLDLNDFRLELKDIEDREDGIVNPDTHKHNTEVTLSGLTFARVVEIINGYTITFEDGQYAVNLVGANSNVADVTNVNQVSVRSQNSAGLISTPLIEYASYEGGVWIDTNSDYSGTLHPVGTRLAPVNNLSDAKLIADYRGFTTIFVIGHLELDADINFYEFIFEGQARVNTTVNVAPITGCTNTVFSNLTVSGTLDGGNEVKDCLLKEINYVNGQINRCGLVGHITLEGTQDAIFADCYTLDPYDPPIIRIGQSGQNLIMPNYSGYVTVENLSSSHFIGIGLNAGEVVLENSIANGTCHVSGVGSLKDTNGDYIISGTWNGGVTVINDTINPHAISEAVWDEPMADHQATGTFGEAIEKIKFWVNYLRTL